MQILSTSNIRFGSEVHSQVMKGSGRAHANRLDHMIEIIAQAGFRGIQPIYSWMGDLSDPGRLPASLVACRQQREPDVL
jgi:inosose dehydratase